MIEHDIKEVLKDKGCAICRVVAERMRNDLHWFELEGHHEFSTLKELTARRYICDRHKAELIKMGNRLSVTFEFLVKKDISFFETLLEKDGRNFKKSAKQQSLEGCKFCLDEEKIEEYTINTFLSMLKENDIRILYENSEGLCRKHLFMLIEMTGKKGDIALFLISDTIKRLNELKSTFEIFFHKMDYRFSNEKKGQEQEVWLDALNFYSNKGLLEDK